MGRCGMYISGDGYSCGIHIILYGDYTHTQLDDLLNILLAGFILEKGTGKNSSTAYYTTCM